MAASPKLKPERPIRRFDIFAEYHKQDEEEKGHPEDEAMGYGLWVAKVVASRHHGGKTKDDQGAKDHADKDKRKSEQHRHLVDWKWRTLDGEPQTDSLFEKEIVDRMGRAFYGRVFSPAIEDARNSGKSYESIRDAIRKGWKPG